MDNESFSYNNRTTYERKMVNEMNECEELKREMKKRTECSRMTKNEDIMEEMSVCKPELLSKSDEQRRRRTASGSVDDGEKWECGSDLGR